MQLSELLLQEGRDQIAINAPNRQHLAAFPHNFQTELRAWLSITFPERIVMITQAIKALPPEALYGRIACVRADLRRPAEEQPAVGHDGNPIDR